MGFRHPYHRNRNQRRWIPRNQWQRRRQRRPWWLRGWYDWPGRNVVTIALAVGLLAMVYADKREALTLAGFGQSTANGLSSSAASISEGFDLCEGPVRVTCVVDGDTIWYRGTKIRMLGIDAPEIHDYKCASELALGQRAKMRLLELMNAGPFEIVADGDRNKDVYGRQLRHINRNGRSLGDILIAEGLGCCLGRPTPRLVLTHTFQ